MKKSFYVIAVSAFCVLGCSSDDSVNEGQNNLNQKSVTQYNAETGNTKIAIAYLAKEYIKVNGDFIEGESLESVIYKMEVLANNPAFLERFRQSNSNYQSLFVDDVQRIIDRDSSVLEGQNYSPAFMNTVNAILAIESENMDAIYTLIFNSDSLTSEEKEMLFVSVQDTFNLNEMQFSTFGNGGGNGGSSNGSQAGNTGVDDDWRKSFFTAKLKYNNSSPLNNISSGAILKVVFESKY